jgi:type II secretory pathway pseudopilin PulG
MAQQLRKITAFSLVEMSIVLVIVGLMTTFVIYSANLSSASKISSIMSDVRYYAKQTERFTELYGGVPGDFANVTILPNYNITAIAGNGNGIIDSATEALQYWVHLQLAGLIAGNYNGTTTQAYDPSNASAVGGFPLAQYPQTIITIDSSSQYGLTYVFSKKATGDYTVPFLSPTDAALFDKKHDDGYPDSGIIRAFNQGSTTTCKNSNNYTIPSNDITCYLKINVENKVSTATAGNYDSCNNSNFGTSRVSSTYTCPIGYTGIAIDHCINSNWVQVRKNCEPVSCGQGLTYGQKITIACASGYSGSGNITYTCSQYGILYPSAETCSATTNASPCSSGGNGITRTFPCPVGYSGTWSQTCNGTNWTSNNFASKCTKLKCSGNDLGSASPITLSNECPSVSGTGWSFKGLAEGVCSLPITTAPITTTTGTTSLAKTYCLANYGTCSGNGSINVNCPFGQTGSVVHTCNGSIYEMTSNTCVPANCGREPVGSWRIAPEQSCGLDSSGNVLRGVVLEICAYTDNTPASCSEGCYKASWQISYAACSKD